MRTMNIAISDTEYDRFGFKNFELDFSEFINIISKELMRQNFDDCISLAEKYGLSSMTMEEITAEVNAVRQNAKNYM
jgi:dimeric dUTPase (all-alpha-NTP-PPase superfamily)